jgi:hypothetical protein
MIATTTSVTTRKTTVKLTKDEVEKLILDHVKSLAFAGDPTFHYIGNGDVYVDFVEEDVHEEDALPVIDDAPIDWNALPSKANWIATDESGMSFWYVQRPQECGNAWTPNGSEYGYIRTRSPLACWELSLQKRPS